MSAANRTARSLDLPSKEAQLCFRPATKRTVVTTTTTTTINFQPIVLPRVPDPQLTTLDAGLTPCQSPASTSRKAVKLDPKLYPLAATRDLPAMTYSFDLPLSSAHGHLNSFFTTESAKMINSSSIEDVDPPSPQSHPMLPHRSSKGKERAMSIDGNDSGLIEPPRKRQKVASEPIAPAQRLRRPAPSGIQAGLLPSPGLSPAPSDGEERDRWEMISREASTSGLQASTSAKPSYDFFHIGNDTAERPLDLTTESEFALSTLLSLPTLVEDFSNLPNALQSHVLINLLRRSPIPVLQMVNEVITPALKRDFLLDLPPELSSLVLCHLDGRSLSLASRVSKRWRRMIDGDERAWLHRLKADGHWLGDGSDERAAAVFEGAPASSARDEFIEKWYDGTWSADFDEEQAAEPTATKLEEARFAKRRAMAASSPDLPTITPRLPNADNIREHAEQMRHSARTRGFHYVHPFKLLYRRRVLLRKKWFTHDPSRLSFAGFSNSTVTCLAFDRKRIVEASDDHVINVYDFERGGRTFSLEGHDGGIWALAYFGDTLVSGATDRTIRVWDMASKRCTHLLIGHTSTVRCLQVVEPVNVNPDKDGPPVWEPPYPLIVSGSRDCTLRVWRLPLPGRHSDYLPYIPLSPGEDLMAAEENPFHLRLLTGHKHAVRAISAYGRVLCSGSYDGTVRIWDLLNGKCTLVLRGHTQKVYATVYDHQNERCMSGSLDGTVRIWSATSGQCLHVLEGHSPLVGLLQLNPAALVSAAADSSITAWHPITGESRGSFSAHSGAITCFKHDQHKILSGSGGTLKMWDLNKNTFVRDLLPFDVTAVFQMAYDERFLVAAVSRNGQSAYEVLDFGSIEGDEEHLHSPKDAPRSRFEDSSPMLGPSDSARSRRIAMLHYPGMHSSPSRQRTTDLRHRPPPSNGSLLEAFQGSAITTDRSDGATPDQSARARPSSALTNDEPVSQDRATAVFGNSSATSSRHRLDMEEPYLATDPDVLHSSNVEEEQISEEGSSPSPQTGNH